MKLRFLTENGCAWVSASQSWDQGHSCPRRDRVEVKECKVRITGARRGRYGKRWVRFAELWAAGRVGT